MGQTSSGDPDDLAARRRLVRRTFDAFSRRDLAALSGLVCEDVELWGPTAREVGRAEPYRGLDGLAVYLRDVATVWEELRLSPGTFQSRGDEIAVVGRTYAWGGGRVVDAPASWAFRLRGVTVQVEQGECGCPRMLLCVVRAPVV